jgi:hypothetical protein
MRKAQDDRPQLRVVKGASCMAAVAWLISACTGNPAAPPPGDVPDQVMFGVRHMMTADGVARARIEADSAYLFVERGVLELHGVSGSLIEPPASTAVATLQAPRGEVDLAANILVARGGVEVVGTVSGISMESEEIVVDPRAVLVYTRTAARIRQGTAAREADRYTADFHLRPAREAAP